MIDLENVKNAFISKLINYISFVQSIFKISYIWTSLMNNEIKTKTLNLYKLCPPDHQKTVKRTYNRKREGFSISQLWSLITFSTNCLSNFSNILKC